MAYFEENSCLSNGCGLLIFLLIIPSCSYAMGANASTDVPDSSYRVNNIRLEQTIKEQSTKIDELNTLILELSSKNAELNSDLKNGRSSAEREKALEAQETDLEQQKKAIDKANNEILEKSLDTGKELGKAEEIENRSKELKEENTILRRWKNIWMILTTVLFTLFILPGIVRRFFLLLDTVELETSNTTVEILETSNTKSLPE